MIVKSCNYQVFVFKREKLGKLSRNLARENWKTRQSNDREKKRQRGIKGSYLTQRIDPVSHLFHIDHVLTFDGFQGVCCKQRENQHRNIYRSCTFFPGCCSVGRQYIGEGHHLRHEYCRSTYTGCRRRC